MSSLSQSPSSIRRRFRTKRDRFAAADINGKTNRPFVDDPAATRDHPPCRPSSPDGFRALQDATAVHPFAPVSLRRRRSRNVVARSLDNKT
jgi:hypothetical protein